MSEVAAREANAAEIDLARHAAGDRMQLIVEEVGVGVRDRPPDRDGARFKRGGGGEVKRADRRLGRAVEVRQRAPRHHAKDAIVELAVHRLAAAEEHTQRITPREERFVEQRAQKRRHEVRDRHALVMEEPRELGWILSRGGIGHHDARARDPRTEELPGRDVEAVGGALQHHVIGAEGINLRRPEHAIQDRAMRD